VRKLVHRCLAKEPAERPNSSEVTVTLAHAAGIHVPLGTDNDDLDGDYEQEWSSSPSTGSGSVGSGGRLSAPLVGVAPDDPYAVRLTKHLDPSLDHVNLRRQASMLLRGAVGFDLAIWAVLDPVTLMWASCVIDGGPHDERFEHELFANEYGQDDVLKLVDLTGDHRIGTVSGATRGDPQASRRFRNVLAPRGFADELRQTFYDQNGTWGALLLYRAEGQFRNDDIAQIAAAGPNFGATLSQALERPDPGAPVALPDDPVLAVEPERPADRPAGRAFRLPRPRLPRSGRTGGGEPGAGARPEDPAPPTPMPSAPRPAQMGALTISHEGRLLDVTADARAMLDAIELDRVGTAVARGRRSGLIDTSGGIRYDGRWLAFHTAREEAAIAVTVQRIRPHQISQFVTRALGLQPWHWRLLGAVARGGNTRQIAQDLQLSVYAVQDGMMALFTAFQVSGRLELLKALFFEHYVPLHASDAVVTPTTT
jgi:hypothetical protein